MARKISTSKVLDALILHGHKLSTEEIFTALNAIQKVDQARFDIQRKRQLANPHPKDIANARSRRARGMTYDHELLGE